MLRVLLKLRAQYVTVDLVSSIGSKLRYMFIYILVSFRFARRTASARVKSIRCVRDLVASSPRLSGPLRVIELGGPTTDDKVDACAKDSNFHSTLLDSFVVQIASSILTNLRRFKIE